MKKWDELPVEIQEKVKAIHIEQYSRFSNFSYDSACVCWFLFGATIEGHDFWYSVLVHDNHDLFYAKYHKSQVTE